MVFKCAIRKGKIVHNSHDFRWRPSGGWRLALILFSALMVIGVLSNAIPVSTPTALAAESWPGVPSVPAVHDQDVEAWWNNHPFNPLSSKYRPDISSPAHRVNVKTQFNGSIQSAISSLPASGGTLYFPAGTYVGGFSLIGKNHVHFVGDPGAVIKSSMQNRVLGCTVAGNYSDFSLKVYQRNAEALACATTGRINDVYFKGITFDGAGSGLVGIYLAAARDIVFDDVTFQNYYDPGNYHRGMITGNALLDNVWVRDSHFIGRERFAIYLDGLHGGGVIDSTFENGFGTGALLFLTNDDFSRDLNNDGRVALAEQRTSQQVVVFRNLFKGSSHHLISATGRQILVKDNTSTGVNATLANFDAKSSHIDSKLTYEYKGNRLVGNRMLQGRNFMEINATFTCPLTANCAVVGEYQARNNSMERNNTYVSPVKENPSGFGAIVGPNVVSNNCVGSTSCSGPAPTPTSPPATPAPATPTATATAPAPTATAPAPTATAPAPSATPTAPAPTSTPVAPAPAAPANLLLNGSFDAVTAGYPSNWRARPTAAWDSTVTHSGNGSLRVTGPATLTYSDQSPRLKPSTRYDVSYWVKTENVSGTGIFVRYPQISPNTVILGQSYAMNGTKTWTKVTFSFTTPSNYVGGRLDIMWQLNGGKAWIDDLTLVEAAGN